VLEKATKRQGTIHYCHSESCDYKETMEFIEEAQPV
jgi:hypothetical protein